MAGEVRTGCRAYRGIGANPVTVIWPGSNPARWSLLQVLSPASRTFTSTLDGWPPPDRRVGGVHPADRADRRRLDVWHERSDEAPAPEHGATDMRLDDHFGSGSTSGVAPV